MEDLLSEHQTLLGFLATLATVVTAFFSYLAAKNSRITNFSNNLPILDLKEIIFFSQQDKTYFRIEVDNESTSVTAHAKNIHLLIPMAGFGISLYMVSPANPPYSSGELIDMIVSENLISRFQKKQKAFLFFEDIFRNKFILRADIEKVATPQGSVNQTGTFFAKTQTSYFVSWVEFYLIMSVAYLLLKIVKYFYSIHYSNPRS